MQRRLAAVMIADVAGYGRLSQADEEGARVRFQADLHEIFEPRLAAHHGRLVKTMGDGLLVEFHSVVDAVRCAVDVQRAEVERNADLPSDRRMDFRIGINLGDVIVEGDDIHGDGVIIAERLQQLADKTSTLISGTAYDHVKGKVAVGFASLGNLPVKNIVEPIRVYRVLTGPRDADDKTDKRIAPAHSWRWPAAAAAAVLTLVAAGGAAWWRPWEPDIELASVERMALPLPDKPSIAVLPFANLSGDPEQGYFADGITDDVITELSKISGLFVISRNSTFVYKGKTVPPRQVSEELGVRYVLEGSVQRAGERLRINAQLIDALDGGHKWADRFDGSLANVFALQDKVTRSIADALAVRLTDAERLALSQQETSEPAAYEAFLHGWDHYRRTTAEDYAKAIPYFEQAIKLDPKYGRAYAAAAMVYVRTFERVWDDRLGVPRGEVRERAERYLEEAQKYPTTLSHQTAGILLWLENRSQFDKAIVEFQEAIALDSSDPLSYAYLGVTLIGAGRPAEAIPHLRTAMRLDPHYPTEFTYFLGLAQFALERFEEAAASFETVTRLNPDDEFPFAALAAAYGYLGRKEDAVLAIGKYDDLTVKHGDVPMAITHMPWLAFRQNVDKERLRRGFRLAGVPESLQTGEFAEQNRLTAEDIRALFFGHRLHGRSWTGQEHAASITTEGIVAASGDWHLTEGGIRFDGYQVCSEQGIHRGYCGAVFRNPGGTKAEENEYIWIDRWGAFTFSQVE